MNCLGRSQRCFHLFAGIQCVSFSQSTPKATPPPSPSQNVPTMITADVDQDEGPKAELDLCTGPKDAYVVEVHLFEQRRLDCKARTTKRTIFYQFEVVRSHEPASFWWENAIAVVILLRVLTSMSLSVGNKLSTVRSFIILRSGEGYLPPSIKITVFITQILAKSSYEKKNLASLFM